MRAYYLIRYFCSAGLVLAFAASIPAEDPLSREAIQQRLTQSSNFLAADELEGRGINTAGIDKAADYLAGEFTRMGLDTKRYQGTPFHTFYMGSRFGLGETNTLALTPAGGNPNVLEVNSDFTPLSLSGSGKVDLPVAFVGYGITAPKLGYDDYAGIDVAGHAVIVLRNEPRKTDVESPFEGAKASEFSNLSHKVTNALQHNAAAILFVTDNASLPEDAAADPRKADALIPFLVKSNVGNRQIPVVHCRRAAIEPLLQAAAKPDLAALEQGIDGDLKPRSTILTGSRVTGEISVVRKGKPLKNVVAVLPGSGPHAEETLILGAHYDHLGFGGSGSLAFTTQKEIHNGADDNGSGTAVLIEAARQLTLRHAQLPPSRRIVFIAFTAEESGLIGSERYVKDPLYPLNQTVAMLNLDMVGRLRQERLTVYGTGTATEFDPLIDRLGTKYAFSIVKKPGGYGPSDHASFYQRSIPVLHFFTGLHKQYHRPEDDADLLNLEGMARISQMVVDAVEELAAAKQRPTLKKVSGGDDIEGLAEALLGGVGDSLKGTKTPVKPGTGEPYLGVASRKAIADVSAPGYLVERVTADGPAATAGIRKGDLILKMGSDPVRTIDDVTTLLKKYKSGDKVTLQVRRGGIDLEIEATLSGR
ncbi:MAG: peptidase [Planctomycetaceae bacterium]|nr:peptidase [Planctomycetaceae bacterium]